MKICKEGTILNRKMTAYLHSAITKIGVLIVSHLLLRFLLPLGTFSCENTESALTLKLSVCIKVKTSMFRLGQSKYVGGNNCISITTEVKFQCCNDITNANIYLYECSYRQLIKQFKYKFQHSSVPRLVACTDLNQQQVQRFSIWPSLLRFSIWPSLLDSICNLRISTHPAGETR